jgi:hypothetical protein
LLDLRVRSQAPELNMESNSDEVAKWEMRIGRRKLRLPPGIPLTERGIMIHRMVVTTIATVQVVVEVIAVATPTKDVV